MVHLMFLLADNPVGPGGFIDESFRGQISTKVYLTKDQAKEKHKLYIEDQIRLMQEEIKADRSQEEEDDEDDEFSSEDVDDDAEEEVQP